MDVGCHRSIFTMGLFKAGFAFRGALGRNRCSFVAQVMRRAEEEKPNAILEWTLALYDFF